jgi:hypothetical protein
MAYYLLGKWSEAEVLRLEVLVAEGGELTIPLQSKQLRIWSLLESHVDIIASSECKSRCLASGH